MCDENNMIYIKQVHRKVVRDASLDSEDIDVKIQ